MQAPRVLIGPETRDRLERQRLPQQVQRRETALGFGVAPGFLALIKARQAKLAHIPRRVDIRRTGAQLRVDTNALPDFQARRRGQLDVRLHANADHHQVAGQPLPVDQLHGVGVDALQGDVQTHIHTLLTVQGQQRVTDHRRQNPPCQPWPGFQ